MAVTTQLYAGPHPGLFTKIPDQDRVPGSPVKYKQLSADSAAIAIRDTLYAALDDSLTALGYIPVLVTHRVGALDSLASLMPPNLQAASVLLARLASAERTGSILWAGCVMDNAIRSYGREGASGPELGLTDGAVFTWTDSTATRGVALTRLTSPPNVKIVEGASPAGTDLYSPMPIEEWTRNVLAPSVLRQVYPYPERKPVVPH
ncbi:MAG: hypothetical protein WDA75_03190 [Candidatus Latescibacterota bacterium]